MLKNCFLILALGICAVRGQVPIWSNFFTNTSSGIANTNLRWSNEWFISEGPINHILNDSLNNLTNAFCTNAPGGAFLRVAFTNGSFSDNNPLGGTQFYGAVLH